MKTSLLIISLIFFTNCGISQSTKTYDKKDVLRKFNMVLNNSAPEYKKIVDGGFSNMEDGVTIGYTVYDLTDTTNINKKIPTDTITGIEFKEGHFYHFVPAIFSMSFSNIAYLENGNIKIFESINCLDKGTTLDEVMNFAKEKLKGHKDEKAILTNIKNYRQFGNYLTEDNYSLKLDCKCSPCD